MEKGDRLKNFAVALVFLGSVTIASATDSYVDAPDFNRSAWEAAAGGSLTTESFGVDQAQSDTLVFASGLQSVAANPFATPNHLVEEGLLKTVLRTSGTQVNGYLTVTLTFPQSVTAFGADFYSIGGSREVSVQGTFDSGLESFDLRTLFIADGGLDRGFFGLVSSVPFNSITLIALGSIVSNDAFNFDEVSFSAAAPPDPYITGMHVDAIVTLKIVGGSGSPITPQFTTNIQGQPQTWSDIPFFNDAESGGTNTVTFDDLYSAPGHLLRVIAE